MEERRRAKVVNSKELEKETNREICLNCNTKLTSNITIMFSSFYSCPKCGYDDADKTIPVDMITNPAIQHTLDYITGKPFGGGGYEYVNGLQVRELTYLEWEKDFVWA